jgi:hypothetical protein
VYLDGAALAPPTKPITLEIPKRNPVLFPDVTGVIDLNTTLLSSASNYDRNNPNLITNLIPKHYLLDASMAEGFGMNTSGSVGEIYQAPTTKFPGGGKIGSPQLISMFLFTWAKQFDELKIFIDHFSKLLHIDYDQYEVVADQFIPFLANYFGFQLPNQFRDSSINQYLVGENLGVDVGLSTRGLAYVQNQIWKRILINMNEIIRSKGTIHSIRAFMLASGINPNRSFRFREFGGVRSRRINDSALRKKLTEISALLDMSGTLATTTVTLNSQGIPDSKPFIMSPFLSSSRVEVGFPPARGSFTNKESKKYGYHGISNWISDGLWTSGSWTYEGVYQFPGMIGEKTAIHFPTQSLMRMHVTGNVLPSSTHGVTVNLTAFSGSGISTGSLVFYARPGTDANSPTLSLEMTGANIFDGDPWHIACGRSRNDEINSIVSSSYFLALAKQSWGRITEYHYTSSYFQETTGTLATFDNTFTYRFNAPAVGGVPDVDQEWRSTSGSFFAFGSQSLLTAGPATDYFLNSIAKVPAIRARTTHFSGRMGHMRFWSKALSGSEIKEHVRNFKSVGVQKPLTHFNFETLPTGSFARLRIDVSTDQVVTQSDAIGDITLFDFAQQFVSGARASVPGGVGPAAPWLRGRVGKSPDLSKNYFHMSGSGFAASARVIQPTRFDYTIINPKFDEASADNKVRIRGFKKFSNIEELGGEVAPVYEIRPSELPVDDTRFGIEISSVQALNEDIVNIFATLETINNAIGNPELVFATSYPDLEDLRKVYFNRLTDKVNFKTFFEFFQWFDTSFGTIIESMIPRRTKFMGVDFVIESHMLERAKFNYNYEDVYVGENNRHGLRGVILLQQLIANIQRL